MSEGEARLWPIGPDGGQPCGDWIWNGDGFTCDGIEMDWRTPAKRAWACGPANGGIGGEAVDGTPALGPAEENGPGNGKGALPDVGVADMGGEKGMLGKPPEDCLLMFAAAAGCEGAARSSPPRVTPRARSFASLSSSS
jgi:hypothetical protein